MIYLIIILIITILALINARLEIQDLKYKIESTKNIEEGLRSNFVKCKTKGIKTIYLNTIIQIKNKDYKILKDGILFKNLLSEGDEVYTILELINIK